MTDAAAITADLEMVFKRIESERMAGVPILNPRLVVEAVGTQLWNGHWLAVLITPWFINLMLLPADDEQRAAWKALALGCNALHRFPAGRFEFIVGEEAALGRFEMCSLFSPVLEFENQEAARLAAEAALEALFDASLDPAAAAAAQPTAQPAEANHEDPTAVANAPGPARSQPPPQASRRGFLTGRIAGSDSGPASEGAV